MNLSDLKKYFKIFKSDILKLMKLYLYTCIMQKKHHPRKQLQTKVQQK